MLLLVYDCLLLMIKRNLSDQTAVCFQEPNYAFYSYRVIPCIIKFVSSAGLLMSKSSDCDKYNVTNKRIPCISSQFTSGTVN